MRKYTTRLSFTVPAGTKARWKALAEAQGISLSEFIRRATTTDHLDSGRAVR